MRHRKDRPVAANLGAASTSSSSDNQMVTRSPDTAGSPALDLAAWAQSIIHQASSELGAPLARYGTRAWARMPAKQRWAAVLIAAEAWRIDGDPAEVARRLAIDVEEGRRSLKRAEDMEYRARAAAHRRQWQWLRGQGAPSEWRDDIDEPDTTPRGRITAEEAHSWDEVA